MDFRRRQLLVNLINQEKRNSHGNENHCVDCNIELIDQTYKIIGLLLLPFCDINRNKASDRSAHTEVHYKQRYKRSGKRIKTVVTPTDFVNHPGRIQQTCNYVERYRKIRHKSAEFNLF